MGDHWKKVWDIAQILVGNFLILCLWMLILWATRNILYLAGDGPEGPTFFGYFPAKRIIDAGELLGLILLVVVSIADLVRVLLR